MREGQVATRDDEISGLYGDFVGQRVGEHLGFDPVIPAAIDVDPLGPTVLDHEDQRATIALDHGRLRHQSLLDQPARLESNVDRHSRAKYSVAIEADVGTAGVTGAVDRGENGNNRPLAKD